MNRLRRRWTPAAFFRLGLLIACAFAAGAARAAQGEAPAQIVIASEGARPPFNYLDAAGELAGFEIDLGRLLCARAKLQCRFVTQDWESLVPGLVNRQYDAVMAALEIGAGPQEDQIAFSKPYIRMPSAFLAQVDADVKDTSPAALKGRRVGVEAGGAHEAYLRDLYPESVIRTYATLEEAILDLGEGRVDFVLGDKDAVTEFLKTRNEGRCCRIVADSPHAAAYFGEGIGIGLRREDAALKAKFNQAIDQAMADGSLARLAQNYFGFRVN